MVVNEPDMDNIARYCDVRWWMVTGFLKSPFPFLYLMLLPNSLTANWSLTGFGLKSRTRRHVLWHCACFQVNDASRTRGNFDVTAHTTELNRKKKDFSLELFTELPIHISSHVALSSFIGGNKRWPSERDWRMVQGRVASPSDYPRCCSVVSVAGESPCSCSMFIDSFSWKLFRTDKKDESQSKKTQGFLNLSFHRSLKRVLMWLPHFCCACFGENSQIGGVQQTTQKEQSVISQTRFVKLPHWVAFVGAKPEMAISQKREVLHGASPELLFWVRSTTLQQNESFFKTWSHLYHSQRGHIPLAAILVASQPYRVCLLCFCVPFGMMEWHIGVCQVTPLEVFICIGSRGSRVMKKTLFIILCFRTKRSWKEKQQFLERKTPYVPGPFCQIRLFKKNTVSAQKDKTFLMFIKFSDNGFFLQI